MVYIDIRICSPYFHDLSFVDFLNPVKKGGSGNSKKTDNDIDKKSPQLRAFLRTAI